MVAASDIAKMVPGFEFLQGLMQNTVQTAGASLPGMAQWIAPTLNPEEIEKRINELKTVQFWLQQNATLLNTTIQALEVQRMTLATLQTMNLPLADLRNSLKLAVPPAASGSPPPAKAKAPAPAAPATLGLDPQQWWGALTQQFTELAAKAMKDSSVDVARHMSKNMAEAVVKQSFDVAGKTLKKAVSMPAKAVARASAPRKR
jgi:hypothetical protein